MSGIYDHEEDEDLHPAECRCWLCEGDEAVRIQYSSEDQRVELWRLFEFSRLGFDGEQVALLLEWEVSPADARKLMERDGERTACTPELAMKILDRSPVLV